MSDNRERLIWTLGEIDAARFVIARARIDLLERLFQIRDDKLYLEDDSQSLATFLENSDRSPMSHEDFLALAADEARGREILAMGLVGYVTR